MMRMIFLFTLFGLLVLFTNCNKQNNPVEEIQYFQMPVGTYWNYQIYDSLLQEFDTISIKVVNKTVINNKSVFLWEFSNRDTITDTLYVWNTPDSVCFYENNNLTNLKWLFKFPIAVGETWSINGNDYYEVLSKEEVNHYSCSFKINRKLQDPNYFIHENIWMVDNVGIVKMTIDKFDLAPVKNQDWRLFSYYINRRD